jgi:hypothetical protein
MLAVSAVQTLAGFWLIGWLMQAGWLAEAGARAKSENGHCLR